MDQIKSVVSETKLPSPYFPSVCPLSQSKETFKCLHCTVTFYLKQDHTLHLSLTSSVTPTPEAIKEQIYSCPECSAEFLTYKGMRQHQGKLHSTEKKVKCKLCTKKFKDHYALKFHKRQVHDKKTQKLCVLCGKVSYNKFTYLKHFKSCSMRFFNNTVVGDAN